MGYPRSRAFHLFLVIVQFPRPWCSRCVRSLQLRQGRFVDRAHFVAIPLVVSQAPQPTVALVLPGGVDPAGDVVPDLVPVGFPSLWIRVRIDRGNCDVDLTGRDPTVPVAAGGGAPVSYPRPVQGEGAAGLGVGHRGLLLSRNQESTFYVICADKVLLPKWLFRATAASPDQGKSLG